MKRALGYFFLSFAALIALLSFFGPYEDASADFNFDKTVLAQGVDTYLTAQEARFPNITPGTEKRVIWDGESDQKTPWSVVYLHGFSATSEEIRPVPDRVAEALGANLVYTRLTGHGRDGVAMGEATVQDWTRDVAEALAIGEQVGERVLVLATSTGATLATYAAVDGAADEVAGMVMVSPNYALANPAAPLLTWPAARYWVGLVAGKTRSFTPLNDGQAQFWTTAYPTVATLPMAALVREVQKLDLAAIKVPALFVYTAADQVVSAQVTDDVVARWGVQAETWQPVLGAQDDPVSHVIAGDIMSPGQTEATIARIVEFAGGL